ncbi:hypothetical protein C0991_009014 [Blastosporella zonata]|nr:hypothetical protein C0991_009014 [Blastosporella zonata]
MSARTPIARPPVIPRSIRPATRPISKRPKVNPRRKKPMTMQVRKASGTPIELRLFVRAAQAVSILREAVSFDTLKAQGLGRTAHAQTQTHPNAPRDPPTPDTRKRHREADDERESDPDDRGGVEPRAPAVCCGALRDGLMCAGVEDLRRA